MEPETKTEMGTELADGRLRYAGDNGLLYPSNDNNNGTGKNVYTPNGGGSTKNVNETNGTLPKKLLDEKNGQQEGL